MGDRIENLIRRGVEGRACRIYTDVGGVSVASVNSLMAGEFDGDDRSELMEGGADLPGPWRPHRFVVPSTNSWVDWGHESSFTSGSWSSLFPDVFLRAGVAFTSPLDLRLSTSFVNSMQ